MPVRPMLLAHQARPSGRCQGEGKFRREAISTLLHEEP